MSTTLAASPTTALGHISASGVALVLLTTLLLGVKGLGKKKLALGPAQGIGFLAELAFLRAGSFWRDLGEAVQTIPSAIAENPELGGIGMTAVCLLMLALNAFAKLVPATAALWGMLTAAAFSAAEGSVWQAIVSFAGVVLSLVGA
ncbi:hypothetical protein [Streptomyces sp. NPDC056549]|uniref:hypothetical protein n=1 Tax=Streptomyces sp. NPDC056549 TaxID=3345864 RepID=UPI0036928AB3